LWVGMASVVGALTICQLGLPTPSGGSTAAAAAGRSDSRAAESGSGTEHEVETAGMKVFIELGCAACHRIGDRGHRGPGRPLTHIRLKLSEGEIADIVLHGASHMPAFQKLPRAKLQALVRFLASLR
jgi:mono/diheme cytochrome c family protein